MNEDPLRVALLCDGSLAIRGALSAIDSATGQFSVQSLQSVAELGDYLAGDHAESRVLLVSVPRNLGPRFLQSVGEWSRSIAVLAVAMATDPEQLSSLIAAGIHGYLDLDAECETLFAALNTVAKGQFFLSGRAVKELFQQQEPEPEPLREPPVSGTLDELTEREQQVLALVADGWTHKQISSRLYLSKATVDTYVQRIRQKLGLRNKAELTRAAVRSGIVSMGDLDERPRPAGSATTASNAA